MIRVVVVVVVFFWLYGGWSWFILNVYRLLQLFEEEGDATSPLVAPKPEPNDQTLQDGAILATIHIILYLFSPFLCGISCL